MGASATKAAWDSAHQLKKDKKALSKLIAWGKSDSNQCGVPLNGTLIRPKTVRDLPSLPIAGIFAGHRHSAAILEDGSVYTWGRNTNGELGIGRRSDSEGMPRMIQQLDPSTRFSNVAIGDTHMLFIDQNGSMWAAGSNDWGQLGLGSPLQSLNSEFDKPRISKRSARFGESSSMPVMVMRDHMNSRLQSMGLQSVATGDAVAGHLSRPPPTLDKESAVSIANTHIPVDAAHVSANKRAAAAAGLSSVSDLLKWNDIVPNQSHFPVRIGRDVSPPFDAFSDGPRVVTFAEIEFNKTLAALGLTAGVRNPQQFVDLLSAMPRGGGPNAGPGLSLFAEDHGMLGYHGAAQGAGHIQPEEAHRAARAAGWKALGLHEVPVVKAAAAGPCSVALTAAGEVWMFGYGHEQQFANGNAVQTEGWPVDGRPARLIAEHGGAVDVVAGTAFCAALTRSGAVVLWGRGAAQGMLCSGGSARFVRALPKMSRIAAGRAHLLMSDGADVWQMRIRHDADSPAAILSSLKRMRFEGDFDGVHQLEAGGDASAVVSPDGKLWMWGQVTDTTRGGELPAAQTAHGQAAMPCVGAARKQPVLITDMDPVSQVALGTNHVLAVTAPA